MWSIVILAPGPQMTGPFAQELSEGRALREGSHAQVATQKNRLMVARSVMGPHEEAVASHLRTVAFATKDRRAGASGRLPAPIQSTASQKLREELEAAHRWREGSRRRVSREM